MTIYAKLVLLLLVVLWPLPAVIAQNSGEATINVIVLDGRNGRPMPREGFLVFIGTSANSHARTFHLSTDKDGVMMFSASGPDLHVQVFPDRQALCYSDPNTRNFLVAEISAKGLSTPNACGSAHVAQMPGRLTVFARPSHWWEKAGW